MNSFFSINEETKAFVSQTLNISNPESFEKIVEGLRQRGFSQLQSVFILIEVGKFTFQQANSIVLNSKTWK